jgi:hypothetical protein
MQERPFAVRRREAGLDLGHAAARLRITPRYLRSLERGEAPLCLRLAAIMSAAYGVRVQDLLTTRRAGGTGKGGDGPRSHRRRPPRTAAPEERQP